MRQPISHSLRCSYLPALVLGVGIPLLITSPANAFSYIFANETYPYSVTHAPGYSGSGGVVGVTVGINPANSDAASTVIPVKNMIHVWNSLVATVGNLTTDPDLGGSQPDWESVMLHELGHSLGLGHVNAATESGLTGENQNYTKAANGPNDAWDLDDGDDNIIGSADDLRNDDINLNYFKLSDNNPFTLAPVTVDSTTYDRDTALLPSGDNFAANGDRSVAAALGYANTETVMQQGAYLGEVQRTLTAEDVAGILYANAGVDEIAGTADDYTINLSYAGITATADIVITESSLVSFAASYNGGTFIDWGGIHSHPHWQLFPGAPLDSGLPEGIFYSSNYDWFYNDELIASIPEPASLFLMLVSGMLACSFRCHRRR